ncbi:beta-N-acetylhexosaminidase [Cytophagales bacterium WSM2-2]|nr:beta-N-acetylhexosaminidase [Cytophagales bacterium WSM2-2]
MLKKLFLILCWPALSFAQSLNIIPQPASITSSPGTFAIDENTWLKFDKKNKDLKDVAELFTSSIRSISGISLPVKSKSKTVSFNIISKQNLGKEGYELIVSGSSIVINANSPAGIFYATQTLLQTLPAIRTNRLLNVPCMTVIDNPRFNWRGMHLDVSRHFFSPDVIKEYIDLMAMYKFNTFHWHLVDDQGWRIEIKKYPKLTEVGAWRADQTNINWRERKIAKPGDLPTYGGYYTQEQIKEIVEYARKRNITVVPEIEMPGHSAAVFASYPQLSCTQKPQLPLTGGDYTDAASNFCAGNDESFNFIQDVLSEVITLFPSSYVHIGGDEVEKGPWKKCERCQARIKAENLKDEDELQSYFIKRIEKFLISKNKKMIGWDEILEGGLAPDATVMSWRGEKGGIEAAKMKHNVVMTPGTPCYFDHYQGDPETEPYAIGGFNTLKRVYDYEPIPKELSDEEGKYVLGAQANLWTEFITTAEHVEYMVLPRMLALGEVVWSPKSTRDWSGFNQRLQSHFTAFEQKGLHYSKGNFKVDIKPVAKDGKLKVSMFSETFNGEIFYTTDGSVPTASGKKYAGEFNIDTTMTIKAVTVVGGRVVSPAANEQSFSIHKAIGRDVTYVNPNSQSYKADGPNSLTDGIRGTITHGKSWHAFNKNDLIATIDLGEEKNIHQVTIGCLQNYRAWIFMPQSVKFEVSADGKSFTEVGNKSNTISVDDKNIILKDFSVSFKDQKVKFIRVTAKNLGVCPPGHKGEGKAAWLFADEIIVN